MPNIAGVYDKKNEEDEDNKQYVGGADGRGGGSGLNVIGPPSDDPYSGIKQNASSGGESADASSSSRTITLYSNGFTVDDGPFRLLTDPANRSFIESMNQGFVPDELRDPAQNAGQVDVKIVNKSQEEYVAPPPPAYVAYSGGGHSTGKSEVKEGALVTSTSDEKPVVDEDKPKTTIMIRCANKKRIKAILNLSHTVRDLQALIQAEGSGDEPYVLMAGFPPCQLTDPSQTIQDAGLAGAQVTQKLA